MLILRYSGQQVKVLLKITIILSHNVNDFNYSAFYIKFGKTLQQKFVYLALGKCNLEYLTTVWGFLAFLSVRESGITNHFTA